MGLKKIAIIAVAMFPALILQSGIAHAVGQAKTTAQWTPTASLTAVRGGATATLLPNGKVLVAGGGSPDSTAATSELYDPTTGTWSPTGNLNGGRQSHSATLLPNGKVLVAGGNSPAGPLATAELYDPATGSWSPTGSMSIARFQHSANLLPNGKVLVAGGSTTGTTSAYQPLASAELYDPTTGTWSPTGNMANRRVQYTATSLRDGKVLVAGGYDYYGVGDAQQFLTGSELYDPASGTWSSVGHLNVPRRVHIASLLPNGKVLVVGGYVRGDASAASAELYDPKTGQWKLTGSMSAARAVPMAALLTSGKVLVAGGYDLTTNTTWRSAELYDPDKNTWSATASMNMARVEALISLLGDGRVLVAGGRPGIDDSDTATAELYEPDRTK